VETAHDVVQNAWIAIHKGIYKLQDPSKFSTWAFRITYNKSMDALRSAKTKGEVMFDEQVDIEDKIESDDSWNTIDELLKKLPQQHKLILTLFYLEQQSIKQIAAVLKLPEGTVKSRVFYARELLKRKYKEVQHEKY
jgi:RNA polymerase sigma-70 factor (ECF subfamily)